MSHQDSFIGLTRIMLAGQMFAPRASVGMRRRESGGVQYRFIGRHGVLAGATGQHRACAFFFFFFFERSSSSSWEGNHERSSTG